MTALAESPEELLRRTPYLVADDPASLEKFEQVAARALATHERAKAAAETIASQTSALLRPYESAMRSELVAESNRMEGYDTTASGVRELVRVREDLLHIEIQSFLTHIRDDQRLLDELGLYRAYMLADEWSQSEQRPREYELRSLHGLVMASHPSGGAYKRAPNTIGGSAHTPIAPWDVPTEMSDMASWFEKGSGDPLLDAAVVHAWLTHIHPFDDGNGRMARLLANLALVQVKFPPLLLRSGADRGQYLDALAASDDGDILPLYALFADSLRKMVRAMERPDFVQRKIRSELLDTPEKRYTMWKELLRNLFTSLEHKVARPHGWSIRLMGYLPLDDFMQLEEGDRDGNGWFAKVSNRNEGERWLLWFGYRSKRLKSLVGASGSNACWPSIYFSRPTSDPRSIYPWTPDFDSRGGTFPNEISIVPGSRTPILVRIGMDVTELDLTDGAALIANALCRS